MVLDQSFYLQKDVVSVSKALLGKYLFIRDNSEQICGGKIVETEAYNGIYDKACHAFSGKRTPRTQVMYQEGGRAYVYLCYGIHYLLNIVTDTIEVPTVVLIRAIEPTIGVEFMLQRRKMTKLLPKLTAGPGALTAALGITTAHNALVLQPPTLWLEDIGEVIPENQIIASPRIGVAYAGEDALLPYRFRILNNIWTSPAK